MSAEPIIETMAVALAYGKWPDGRTVNLCHRDEPPMFLGIMLKDREIDLSLTHLAVSRALQLRNSDLVCSKGCSP